MSCKILFSSHHIFHPLTVKNSKDINKNIELNIKIKTIFITILAFLLTAGVGGIVCFYCLTAKHKVKVLEEIKRKDLPPPARPTTPSRPPPARPATPAPPQPATDPAAAREESVRLGIIKTFVSDFLFPYIHGRITPETENPDRKPLLVQLQEAVPSWKVDDEAIALEAFFNESALGLFIHLNKHITKAQCYSNLSKADQLAILLKSLKRHVPAEFPGCGLSDTELETRAKSALAFAKEHRKTTRSQASFFKPLTVQERLNRKKARSDLVTRVNAADGRGGSGSASE